MSAGLDAFAAKLQGLASGAWRAEAVRLVQERLGPALAKREGPSTHGGGGSVRVAMGGASFDVELPPTVGVDIVGEVLPDVVRGAVADALAEAVK